ncbi:hypothetical protein ACFPQ1_27070, partial [Rhodocytophaga aerolata]
FHHSIGGYHAAKLQRFGEVSDSVLFPELNRLVSGLQSQSFTPAELEQLPVLNMLNTKYFILGNDAQSVLQNPYALGNAWFVQDHKIVANANEELQALKSFDPARTAIVKARYEPLLNAQSLQWDSTARIHLTAYSPDHLVYQSIAEKHQLAVFSEIYYQGNNDWQAYVDGKAVPHMQVNYLLRAMVVPAGMHKIEFIYTARTYEKGEVIALISSILLSGFVITSLVMTGKQKAIA